MWQCDMVYKDGLVDLNVLVGNCDDCFDQWCKVVGVQIGLDVVVQGGFFYVWFFWWVDEDDVIDDWRLVQ